MNDQENKLNNICQQNFGALRVMNKLYQLNPKLNLDIFIKFNILGPKIWMFYKDICGEINKVLY